MYTPQQQTFMQIMGMEPPEPMFAPAQLLRMPQHSGTQSGFMDTSAEPPWENQPDPMEYQRRAMLGAQQGDMRGSQMGIMEQMANRENPKMESENPTQHQLGLALAGALLARIFGDSKGEVAAGLLGGVTQGRSMGVQTRNRQKMMDFDREGRMLGTQAQIMGMQAEQQDDRRKEVLGENRYQQGRLDSVRGQEQQSRENELNREAQMQIAKMRVEGTLSVADARHLYSRLDKASKDFNDVGLRPEDRQQARQELRFIRSQLQYPPELQDPGEPPTGGLKAGGMEAGIAQKKASTASLNAKTAIDNINAKYLPQKLQAEIQGIKDRGAAQLKQADAAMVRAQRPPSVAGGGIGAGGVTPSTYMTNWRQVNGKLIDASTKLRSAEASIRHYRKVLQMSDATDEDKKNARIAISYFEEQRQVSTSAIKQQKQALDELKKQQRSQPVGMDKSGGAKALSNQDSDLLKKYFGGG